MKAVRDCYRQGLALLSPQGRRVLYLYGAGLVTLGLLDGLALFFVSQIFTLSGDGNSIGISAGELFLVVVLLFSLRTFLSTAISWVAVRRFALEELRVGSINFEHLMFRSWNDRVDSSSTDLFNGVDRGPTNMVQGLLLNVVTIVAQTCVALLILVSLFVLQPLTAGTAALYFAVVALLQHRLLSHSSSRAGSTVVSHTNDVYETLTDAHALGKLLAVNPSQSLRHHLEERRRGLALARGRVIFLGLLPRYFMELILAIGIVIIAGVTRVIDGPEAAISAITIFAAAGFRLLPIVNRIQGLILQLFSTLPSARLAIVPPPANSHRGVAENLENDVVLKLENVSFRYPSSSRNVLSDIDLILEFGLQYAVVGPSGAGKTTLVDICLGLLTPESGTTTVMTTSVAYVPQDTHVARLPLHHNIAVEWNETSIDTALVGQAIQQSQLTDFLESRSGGVPLSGQALSGGQKQRIGLARAMYRKPKLLFLDEVTSSLDSETEHAVMSSIEQLRGSITTVIVAHRLTTVQRADKVIYMDEEKIRGIGTFEELRKMIPEFQRQIELGTLDLND